MIQDLDNTLRALLNQKVPLVNPVINMTGIDINFEMPDQEWETKLQNPTINIFLYDIRENLELRRNERFIARQGVTGSVTRDPVRMDFSYMVTVWTPHIEDEHRLLGNLLKTLLGYPILPPEVLQGEMVNASPPLRAWVSQPERIPNGWEFWTVLEGRLKAGLSYVVTVPVQPLKPDEVYLVTEKLIKFKFQIDDSSSGTGTGTGTGTDTTKTE